MVVCIDASVSLQIILVKLSHGSANNNIKRSYYNNHASDRSKDNDIDNKNNKQRIPRAITIMTTTMSESTATTAKPTTSLLLPILMRMLGLY